jgi:hypothetical protein
MKEVSRDEKYAKSESVVNLGANRRSNISFNVRSKSIYGKKACSLSISTQNTFGKKQIKSKDCAALIFGEKSLSGASIRLSSDGALRLSTIKEPKSFENSRLILSTSSISEI